MTDFFLMETFKAKWKEILKEILRSFSFVVVSDPRS